MGTKPFSRTVQQMGNGSFGVTIPKEVLEENGVEKGDEVGVDYDRDSNRVIYDLD